MANILDEIIQEVNYGDVVITTEPAGASADGPHAEFVAEAG